MASMVQSSIPSTSTGSALFGTFTWSDFPLRVDTCTSPTLNWNYSGPPGLESFLFLLNVANSSTAPNFTPTVLAEDIDVASVARWTWKKANVTAGEYVVVAYRPTTATVVPSPVFMITNGTDTTCFGTQLNTSFNVSAGVTDMSLPTTTITPSSDTSVPPAQPRRLKAITIVIISVGALAGAEFLMAILAMSVFRVRRLRRTRCPSSPGSRGREAAHSDLPSLYTTSTTQRPQLAAERGAGGIRPLDHITPESPLVPNRRPPSCLISELSPPALPHRHPLERISGSIIDASTIGSRISVTSSDVASTAELMGTFSSFAPSYVTNPSLPPSYATDDTHGTATPGTGSSRSARMSYASTLQRRDDRPVAVLDVADPVRPGMGGSELGR